jgi:pyruvate formate lyase activating enzyme
MTGTITDIHRTSVVDGPGLRTTVFLKGCPLRCLWCHNPETQRRRIQLGFDPSKCRSCGSCVAVCPTSALSLHDGKARIDRALCTDCGQCAEVCPSGALFLYGKEMTDDEVLAEVVKDRAYYDASGGGVTISGGEPMAQPEFTLSLLRKCREAGIHTALDTTGFFPRQLCEMTLAVTDLYLFDYKATDAELHLEVTGVPLAPILEMLEFLLSRSAKVLLRCPMIPGLNDQEDHLAAIAEMERRFPSLAGIEILPWHTMGNSKYVRLGRLPAPELPVENVAEEIKSNYRHFFAGKGCGKVRIC